MPTFEEFVQIELPKRPFVSVDGLPGQTLVRSSNGAAPRELVWADPASGTSATFQSTINPNEVEVLQILSALNIRTSKWIVSATDETLSKTKSCEILSTQLFDSTMRFNVSSIIGDNIPIKYDVVQISGEILLTVTNNSINTIIVNGINVTNLHK